MNYRKLVLCLLINIPLVGFGQGEHVLPKFPSISFVNKIEYKEAKFNKDTVGNSFLIKYNNRLFAVTAKHILMLAKTDKMETVQINEHLKQWTMYSKQNAEENILVDKVLNESSLDSLNWKYFGKRFLVYQDWLVMSVKSNNGKSKVLEFRKTPLQVGEPLYVVGWSYVDRSGEQRVYEYSYFKEGGIYLYMRNVNGAKQAFGLSGSPVIDKEGLLVGVVSLSDRDPVTKEVFLLPCKVNILEDILKTVSK